MPFSASALGSSLSSSLEMATIAPLCAVIAISALFVTLLRKPVHAAMALLGHSLALAALYLALSAELLAAAQVLIYSGAIVVLFIFVVALLPADGRDERIRVRRFVTAGVVVVLLGGTLAIAVGPNLELGLSAGVPTTLDVGRSLFDELFLPFELSAPLLLCAFVGAVALWRRQER